MKTMAHLVTEASIMLGDSTHAIWSSAELQRYCKDGYRRLMRQTRVLWDQAYVNDQAGVSDYDLPDTVALLDRATWGGRPLTIETEGRLMRKDARYKSETRTGSRPYAIMGSGIDTIRKWPPPSTTITSTALAAPTTDSVNNTRIEFFSYGPDPDSIGFELPEYMTRTIRHYMLAKAYGRNGKGHNKKFEKHYMQRWEIDLTLYLKIVRTVGMAREGHVGGAGKRPRRRPAAPRLPWEYGRRVRG
jgi:hypothetical protein